jgi:hypothetical protein
MVEDARREGRLSYPAEPNNDGVIAAVVWVDGDCGENAPDALLTAKDDGRRRRWIERRAAKSR